MRRLLFSLFFVLCWIGLAFAGTNYYIDPSSNFTISGSSGTPTPFEWLTQATSGAQAIFCFKNGSTVTVSAVLGTPDSSHTWTGAYSSATFTPSSAPTANGSDSNTGTQAAPWQTGVHACGAVTGSQAGNAILIRQQTVCYNDTFLIGAYGSSGNNFTLGTYLANAGDGTLNPRVYAAVCLPTGTGYGIWTKTSGLSNTYQASLSSLKWINASTEIAYWFDWWQVSAYPGSNGIGTGTYGGQGLEQCVGYPGAANWYLPAEPLGQMSGGKSLSTSTMPAVAAGGSGYSGSSVTLQILQSQSGGMVSVGQVTASVSGGAVQSITSVNIQGCDYTAANGVATYCAAGGSGCTVNLTSSNLVTTTLAMMQQVVDNYPRTMYYDSSGKNLYIHNPFSSGDPYDTAGYNIWVNQYFHGIGMASSFNPYITVSGIDCYYGAIGVGTDDSSQTRFGSYWNVQNCNTAFNVYEGFDMNGYGNSFTNCNTSYYMYAGCCPFDAGCGSGQGNAGYQTDQVTITQCSDSYPVLSAQFGAPQGGLFGDFSRCVNTNISWPTYTYGTFTTSAPAPFGTSNSTITSAICTSSGASATTASIPTISGNTYSLLFNYNPVSGQAPVLTMSGGTLVGSPITLVSGWNTATWTPTGSSATFTITNTAAASFALTLLTEHQVTVLNYSLYNPNGSKAGTQDYLNAISIQASTNSSFTNINFSGQVEQYLLNSAYNLNPTYNKLIQLSVINAGWNIRTIHDDGFVLKRSQLYCQASVSYGCAYVSSPGPYSSVANSCSRGQWFLNNIIVGTGGSTGVIYYAGTAVATPNYFICNTFYDFINPWLITLTADVTTYIYDNIFESCWYIINQSASTFANVSSNYNNGYGVSGHWAQIGSTTYTLSTWQALGSSTHDGSSGTSTAKMVNPSTTPASGNFHLIWGSPCINSGSAPPAGAPTQDADYNEYNDGIWDKGAYKINRGGAAL